MNHDVTHCNNILCSKRYSCRRYLLHLELKSPLFAALKNVVPYLMTPQEKKCTLFILNHEFNEEYIEELKRLG